MRAPLRALRNFAALQEEECLDCPRKLSLDYFERIKIAAARMDRLMTDSLSFSKAVRQQLPIETVDLEVLLRGLIKTYPNLQPDSAEIRLETALPLVLGNEAASGWS
jgi:light-regulated signal transduction histidine kinase (bacteriophytochrome)